jgi:nicotinate phosphoribosyltransferase
MGYLANIYTREQTSPTMTDRYHYTTGYGYWVEGRADNMAIGYIFGRKEAEGGGYTVEAGIEGIIDIIKRWKDYGLTAEDKQWLAEQGYPEEYITYLHELLKDNAPIQVDVCKTNLFFPQEPVVRLKGPIVLIKMLESINLCIENGQSAYATHSARMAEVLKEEVESGAPKGAASVQGLRRGPGIGAAIEAPRALALGGGYISTSTGRAAEMLGIKFAGTMDHAWVQTHDYQLNKEPGAPTMKDLFQMQRDGRIKELQEALSKDAFRSYAFTNLSNGILLTDTYDTPEGIEDAITVIKELRELGYGKNYGMRFDSGDLVEFSKLALRRLAERNEGDLLDALPHPIDLTNMSHKRLLAYAEQSTYAPFCSASDGVNVYSVQDMRRAGAYIKSFGVGTAGSHVAPLGLVQKVSAMYMRPLNGKPIPDGETMTPTMKIVSAAPVKSSNPGMLNSRRFYGADGAGEKLSHIVIWDEDLGMDPESRVVNLRDFSDTLVKPGALWSEDILEPVFDKNGRYVYVEPLKKPDHPGSSHMVTDLSAIAAEIREELKTLPDDVRRIHRPRKEVLQDTLLRAFEAAQKAGRTTLTLDIAAIEADLPPPQAHIPIYLDQRLYEQRVACEARHSNQARPQSAGVGAYTERFEGPTN